jgi:HSP20 family protein
MKTKPVSQKKLLGYVLVLLGLVAALQIYIVMDRGTLRAQAPDTTPQPTFPDSLTVMPSPGQILPFGDGEWDPFEHMQRMQEQMNRMFGTLWDSSGAWPTPTDMLGNAGFAPDMDLQDEGDRFVVSIELDESEAASLEIDAQEESLTIHGTREEQVEERDADGNVTSSSQSSSRFSRSVALPEPVVPDRMESHYEDGVLRIELPKKYVDS